KTPPATTDDLLTAVKGGLKLGLNENAYHNWAFYSGFGGKIFDDNGNCVADGPVGDALKYLADLKAAGAKFYTDGSKLSGDFKTVNDACTAVNKANNKTGTGGTGGAMPKVTGSLTVWESYGSSHGSAESNAWTAALAQFQKDNPDAKITTLDVPFDQLFNKFE